MARGVAVGPEGGEARVLEARGDGGAFAMAEELVGWRGGWVSGMEMRRVAGILNSKGGGECEVRDKMGKFHSYNLHQLEFELFGIKAVEFFLRVRPAGDEGRHRGGGSDRTSWRNTTATRKGSLRSSQCMKLQKANGRVV